MSTAQQEKYERLKAAGFEYQLTEPDGTILMKHIERGYDYERTLQTIAIKTDGTFDDK